jgi:hypothetical protein
MSAGIARTPHNAFVKRINSPLFILHLEFDLENPDIVNQPLYFFSL